MIISARRCFRKRAELETQNRRLRMENAILEKASELIKKRGRQSLGLTSQEKTKVVDALRNEFPLANLLRSLKLARSTYFYRRMRQTLPEKYAQVRATIRYLFEDNYRCYGYRRIDAALRREGVRISEKVVRRLMAEECLIVKTPRRRRFSTYAGEPTPAPPNLLNRNFRASAPNTKWLTDLTEIHIPAGKIYVSPIVDCFDGLVVAWNIGTSPDAKLVNTMLDYAVQTLKPGERPIIHSDRRLAYRWPNSSSHQQRQTYAIDVQEGLLARQCRLRGVLRPLEERTDLFEKLAGRHAGGLHEAHRRLYLLV